MQNMIQSIKKKNLGKEALLIANVNSKSFLSSYSSQHAHSTINNNANASAKELTYFSFSLSTHDNSNYYSPCYLVSKEIELKKGFNASLQHTFFDWEKEFYFSKIHLICPAKFDRNPKRKIIFPCLPTTAAPTINL